MHRPARITLSLAACLAVALAPAWAAARPDSARPSAGRYRVDRVVLLIRHGIRAPLDGEAAAAPLADQPFPRWNTPPSQLTPHGAQALERLASYMRTRFVGQGLLPGGGCPQSGQLAIWTNSKSRTIASGQALAQGLAPGCAVPVEHRPEGQADPLFDAFDAQAVPFDARAAAASINAELDQGRALMVGMGPAVATIERVLGCRRPCPISTLPNRIAPSADGKGLTLSGPIDLASGTAQVFLLQYTQGMPLAQVGWGRASAADIAAMSPLHARLFDVFARSAYMAPRVGGLIARRIATTLTAPRAPAISVLVGHDNTIAAVTALLGTGFQLPGYGRNDPPIGGGLLFERLIDRRTGRASLRLSYLAQTPDQARSLAPLPQSGPAAPRHPLAPGRCGPTCTPQGFAALIAQETKVLDEPR
jgi:4-phytase/acid phosphatase